MNLSSACLLVCLLATLPTHANESPWRLGVAAGYGMRSNPLVFSDDIPIVVDLDIAWFGKRFFFDNGDVGYTVADNDFLTGSFIARVNSDRVFFAKTNTPFIQVGLDGAALSTATQVKVPDRDYAIEAGFEMLADGRWGAVQMAVFHDVSGTHGGFGVDMDYRYGFGSRRWYFTPSVGLSYKSEHLNDYYWGVQPEEAAPGLPPYEAGAGINVRARLGVNYFLSRHWVIAAAADYERLNDEAATSPIVKDSGVVGWFLGMRYRF